VVVLVVVAAAGDWWTIWWRFAGKDDSKLLELLCFAAQAPRLLSASCGLLLAWCPFPRLPHK